MQELDGKLYKEQNVYYPLLSVAITTYNSSKFILPCIRSIHFQSYKNYEVILVDDCSKDDTLKVVQSISKKYKMERKLKIFTHSFNCGYGQSLKHAIEFGTGELVVIVDSDDAICHHDAFKMLVEAHYYHPEASLVFSDYFECDEKLRAFKKMTCTTFKEGQTYLGKFDGDRYLGNNVRVSHIKCFKRSFYDKTEGVDGTLQKFVDKDLVLKLEEVGKLHHIPMPLYLYRIHPHSITKMWSKRSEEYRRTIMENKLKMYRSARDRRTLKKDENIL